MPSPKDGTAGTLVSPAEVTKADEADTADPGQVESVKAGQRQTSSGKYGSTQVQQHKNPETPEEKKKAEEEGKTGWIEIVLEDEEGNPVPGVAYKIVLPDDKVATGTLDAKGFARVAGIKEGNCKVSFPKLDKSAWEAS